MNTKTKQGGLGIVSILTIVFIVLKLSGVIKWHWIWVLSPIWISALTAVILFAGILIGGRLKKRYTCRSRGSCRSISSTGMEDVPQQAT